MAKGHHEDSTRREQGSHPRHCPLTLQLVKMHPYSREHDDIESLAASAQASEVGQAVVNPFEGMRSMQLDTYASERIRWLDACFSANEIASKRFTSSPACSE